MGKDALTLESEIATRFKIRELIDLYFHAADTHNYSLWAQCFAPNASMAIKVGTPDERLFQGRNEIVRQLTRIQSHDACHHVSGNVAIRFEASTLATATTFVIAHLLYGQRLLVRGTRLDDQIVPGEDGWVFEHRKLRSIWQYEVPTMTPGIPADLENREL
jgi:SnoaL-like domain